MANRGQVGAHPTAAIETGEVAPADSAGDVAHRLEDAVASVVVVALTEQFDGKPISVNIESYDVQVSGARERMVSGRGQVGIGNDGAPIAFSYRTLYDVLSANAGYPSITVGQVGAGVERSVPNDALLIGELDERVASTLSGELGGKRVWLQFDDIQTFESGDRYVRINATGIADFGPDGSTPTRVEALYDRDGRTWLRVNYELGAAAAGRTLVSSGG